MAQDLPSLLLATKSLLDAAPWNNDCDVIELPWREDLLLQTKNRALEDTSEKRHKSLTFAVLRCDGHVTPHPPIQRATMMVANALQLQGFEVGR